MARAIERIFPFTIALHSALDAIATAATPRSHLLLTNVTNSQLIHWSSRTRCWYGFWCALPKAVAARPLLERQLGHEGSAQDAEHPYPGAMRLPAPSSALKRLDAGDLTI